MSRCYQCNWVNPDDAETCQKCGQPLKIEKVAVSVSGISLSKTGNSCDKCGYPLSSLLNFCPWCGEGKPADDNILSDHQPITEAKKDDQPEKSVGHPYLERNVGGVTEIISLLDSSEVIINGISYIYHH